jgi:pimeloyl-ACP methyl ester carboxylesterase
VGTGDSTRPTNIASYSSVQIAAANDAFARRIAADLREGSLAAPLEPIERPFLVGVGGSMGAYLTVRQQALHRSYDAIAPMGWGLALEKVWSRLGIEAPTALTEEDLLADSSLRELVSTAADAPALRDMLIGEGVAVEVANVAATSWSTSAPGPAAIGAVAPEFARLSTAAIDVPTFLAYGEYDFASTAPRTEPAAYERVPEVTLIVLPDAGHSHNTAQKRELLWRRLTDWARAVDDAYG